MGAWIPPLRFEDRDPRAPVNRQAFLVWLAVHRPDAIMALDSVVASWLAEASRRIPADTGLAFLELSEHMSSAGGIDRRSERIGAAAIAMAVTIRWHKSVFPGTSLVLTLGSVAPDNAGYPDQERGGT
jgi:hypothetical protein